MEQLCPDVGGSRGAPGADDGFALISVVLLLIGLAVLATGLVFSAAQQSALAGSTHDVARARRAAEAALGSVLEAWSAAERSLDPVGAMRVLLPATVHDDGVTMEARSRRISAEVFLVTGTGRAAVPGTAPIRQSAARVVRSLDLDSIGGALDAALVAGSVRLGPDALVQGSGADALPADPVAAALCAGWSADASAVRAPADSVVLFGPASLTGAPILAPDAGALRSLDGLGFLDRDALAGDARAVARPAMTSGPVVRGLECDTAASGSWGASAGPCSGYHPLLHASASLSLDGGYGQGILIVDEDLVLDGGFHWRGLLIVGGTLTIRDARVEGVAISGRVRMDRGIVALDRCALASSLTPADATRRARFPARSWIPTFD